jgi:hypothetical protein
MSPYDSNAVSSSPLTPPSPSEAGEDGSQSGISGSANGTRAIWWAVPASCILILLTLAMLLGSPEHTPEKGTSYDASWQGFRAAYLLLERLGYPVVRLKRPLGASIRWVLFPKPSRDDPAMLKQWLRGGGTLVLADNSPEFARQLGVTIHIKDVDATEPVAATSSKDPPIGKGQDEENEASGDTPLSPHGHRGQDEGEQSSGTIPLTPNSERRQGGTEEASAATPRSPPGGRGQGEGGEATNTRSQVFSEMKHIDGGSTRTEGPQDFDERWLGPDGQPLVTIYRQGRGEIWLLNRPEFLTNRLIAHGDNALLLCRIADSLSARPGAELAFDEYVHGLRDRPNVLELLATPPTLWVTIQAAVVIGLVVWHAAPRFGAIRISPPGRRRSKEEFLDAMASLLERCEDYDDAWQSVRAEFSADLAQALGLPADTPLDQVAEEAHRRGRISQSSLNRLRAARRPDRQTFPAQLTQLESIRDEFFSRRPRG